MQSLELLYLAYYLCQVWTCSRLHDGNEISSIDLSPFLECNHHIKKFPTSDCMLAKIFFLNIALNMAEQTGSKQSFDEMFSQENLFLLLRDCHLQPSVVLCSLPNFSVVFMQILPLSFLWYLNMASTSISCILLLKMFYCPTKYQSAHSHIYTHIMYFNILGTVSLQSTFPNRNIKLS